MIPATARDALAIAGRGEADRPAPELFDAAIRAKVRYADPVAWTTAAAVARALAGIRNRSALADEVAVVVSSDVGPQEAMTALADAARNNFSSPLRYPAAAPGSLAGVSCIAFGFRGPTLNFILPPVRAVLPGFLVAAGWLRRAVVPCVVFAGCVRRPSGELLARCLVLSAHDSTKLPGAAFTEHDATWLALSEN
jgi:hypothetical protein